MKLPSVVVTSYAKAPQNTGYYEVNKYIGVVLEIQKDTDLVISASATFVTDTAKSFFSRLVVGTHMINGIEELIQDIESHYFAPSTQSIIMALKIAQQRYLDVKSKLQTAEGES